VQHFCIDVARELVGRMVLLLAIYTLLKSDPNIKLSSYKTYAIEHLFASCTSLQLPCWWKALTTRGTGRLVERRRVIFTEFADCSVTGYHGFLTWSGLGGVSQALRQHVT